MIRQSIVWANSKMFRIKFHCFVMLHLLISIINFLIFNILSVNRVTLNAYISKENAREIKFTCTLTMEFTSPLNIQCSIRCGKTIDGKRCEPSQNGLNVIVNWLSGSLILTGPFVWFGWIRIEMFECNIVAIQLYARRFVWIRILETGSNINCARAAILIFNFLVI